MGGPQKHCLMKHAADLVFGTSNPNKLKEIRHLIPSSIRLWSMQEVGIDQELPEDQDTIAGNAEQKVHELYRLCGKNCFAEDTGLIVEALNGDPGVYSARYAGPQRSAQDNMDLLLHNLRSKDNRNAHFLTVIALHWEGGLYTFKGIVEGHIAHQAAGKGGFGYDPIFIPSGYQKSFGELPSHVKNQMSHRARAVLKLITFLESHSETR